MSAPRLTIRLKRALLRLLWNSVCDQADCTCAPRDRCPECGAMLALGLGRWKNWKHAHKKMAALGLELGGRGPL